MIELPKSSRRHINRHCPVCGSWVGVRKDGWTFRHLTPRQPDPRQRTYCEGGRIR